MIPESEVIFKISGSALSFLYYECDKSRMDQVGFLIGEKHSFVKKTISDLQMNGEKNETIINIVAVLPVGAPFLFCNNVGRIDKAKLKTLLGSVEKDVCGWYIFRRNCGLNPLLRGTILHRELLDALPHVLPQSFTLCCIGSDTTQSRSTHRFKHVFLLHRNRNFEPISVPIINLGQPEDNAYRTLAVTTSSNKSFNDIASSIRLDNNSGALAALKALQKPLQDKIMEIASEVQQFDRKTQELINEIQELKDNEMIKRQNKMASEKKSLHDSKDHKMEQNVKKDKEVEDDDVVIEEEEKEMMQDDVEENVDKEDNEGSEEIVYCSQNVKTYSSVTKKKDKSKVNTRNSPLSEKIVIEESNSPKHFSPSEEY